jgi:cytochrome c-type biogenesis protein CcsB
MRKAKKRTARAAALLLPVVLALGAAASAGAAEVPFRAPLPDAALAQSLASLPVQHDGRTMPFDTVAREGVWQVTGSDHGFRGIDPVTLALAWAFHSDAWSLEPVVKVGSGELATLAGLPAGASHGSFRQLAGSQTLLDLYGRARAKAQADEPRSPLEEDAAELEQRLLWMKSVLDRSVLRTIPAEAVGHAHTGGPADAWAPLPASVGTVEALAAWYEAQRAAPPPGYPAFAALERELDYNRVQPSRLAWWILLPAMLVSLGAMRMQSRLMDLAAIAALVAGFAVMSWGIGIRWAVAGRIPASNMYESMLFLGWGIGLFALIAAALLRNRLVIFNAAAMAALTMTLVDLLPVDPFIHPMAPVLSGTPWLAIHVPIIMVSYSVLALGVLIAHLQIGVQIFRPAKRELVARFNDLLYWYMHIGSLLLVAGIITGSIWAASSWGRYWGWDPKEVWSLIAFLAYMAILHSRFDKQIGPFGVAAASIVAFWTVLMTYLGVNFILASGLHSYGFGSGGLVGWMSGIAALEVVFLAAGYVAHRRGRATHGPLRTAVT